MEPLNNQEAREFIYQMMLGYQKRKVENRYT